VRHDGLFGRGATHYRHSFHIAFASIKCLPHRRIVDLSETAEKSSGHCLADFARASNKLFGCISPKIFVPRRKS
jgi:hypothetical protein